MRSILLATGLALAATSAVAQPVDHSGMDHSAMDGPGTDETGTDETGTDETGTDDTGMDHSGMDHSGMDMPGMAMPGMDHGHRSGDDHSRSDCVAVGATMPAFANGSGTSRLPGQEGTPGFCGRSGTPHPPAGLHLMAGNWMAMIHGAISAQYTAASGPRGDHKLYSTSMLMASLGRDTSWGKLELRSMVSLEPSLRREGYPNLFATGETAYGQPLVDRQHPHDLFMELTGRIDLNLTPATTLFIYGGPVGEPALGPSFFAMRGAAAYNPEPPITHHWFDSTHISYGVVTAGVSARHFQLEASAFRGREPDEQRWNIESGKLDSWSLRATVNPSPRWSVQASYAEIKQPEATHPGEDEHRFTASAHFSTESGLKTMLAFSAKRRVPGETLTAWLGEASWNVDAHNTLFGRIENVSNDELFPDHNAAEHDHALRITKLQTGYARRLPVGQQELALGASAATFFKPADLNTAYGRQPIQITVFARVRI